MKKVSCIVLILVLLLTSVIGCSQPASTGTPAIKDGTYTVESKGNEEGMKLEVVFAQGKISSVKILEHHETAGVGDPAIERLPALIAANNSVNVDTVAGATNTSKGIIDGVKKAIAQAGGRVEDFSAPVTAGAKETKKLETEVVVIGAGISGMTSALSLSQHGVKVILLEKAAKTGGSLALASGNFISVNSNVAKEAGIDDNMDTAMKLFRDRAATSPRPSTKFPDYDRVKSVLGEEGKTIDWLKSEGVPFIKVNPSGTELVIINTDGKGAAVAKVLDEKVRTAGVDVRTDTPAKELIAENGKVVGVKAESPSEMLEIRAQNVVLACGGFGQNDEMISKYAPEFNESYKNTAAGNTGDGFAMAAAVGAALYDEFWMMPSTITPNKSFTGINSNASTLVFTDKALVDTTGKRYVNESLHYSIVTNALATRKAASFVIFDSSSADVVKILESGLSGGDVYKGATAAELGKAAGIDGAALEETIKNYNRYAASGKDADFGKAKMTPYGSGPYYAVRYIPSSLGTLAGVVTDYQCHVLNADGKVIEGLYAVGEMSNKSFYNQGYLSAASLGLYSTMGRLIGEELGK